MLLSVATRVWMPPLNYGISYFKTITTTVYQFSKTAHFIDQKISNI